MRAKKIPLTGERPGRGGVGNIDASHLTRSASNLQAQTPVFPLITLSLPGGYREVLA